MMEQIPKRTAIVEDKLDVAQGRHERSTSTINFLKDELRREVEEIIKSAFGELASDLPTKGVSQSILSLIRMREIEARIDSVNKCESISVMIKADQDEERDKIRAKASNDIHNAIRVYKNELKQQLNEVE